MKQKEYAVSTNLTAQNRIYVQKRLMQALYDLVCLDMQIQNMVTYAEKDLKDIQTDPGERRSHSKSEGIS